MPSCNEFLNKQEQIQSTNQNHNHNLSPKTKASDHKTNATTGYKSRSKSSSKVDRGYYYQHNLKK